MKYRCVQIIGWYGVLAILFGYILISFSILKASSLAYQLLNFTGALGVVLETYSRKDYQPFWLNVVWTGIALIAIISALAHLK